LIDHALAAISHRGDYVSAFEKFGDRWLHSKVTKEEYEAWYKTLPAGLQLVKDEGAYLMSNGLPGLPVGRNAVYAEGFANADFLANFDATYDRLRQICGGDDFVQTLPLDAFQALIGRRGDASKLTVVIDLTENKVLVSFAERTTADSRPRHRRARSRREPKLPPTEECSKVIDDKTCLERGDPEACRHCRARERHTANAR